MTGGAPAYMHRGAKADVRLYSSSCEADAGPAAASAEVSASWLSIGIASEQASQLELALEFCRLSST